MKGHTGTLTLSADQCKELISVLEAAEAPLPATPLLRSLYALERTLLRLDMEALRAELSRFSTTENLDLSAIEQ
ncbi:MAG: hypothetical protein OXG44_15860 [Gammaproteobacteria bacterium]|nr:hypothetical protein [Gammaproteobacteria bacterium]